MVEKGAPGGTSHSPAGRSTRKVRGERTKDTSQSRPDPTLPPVRPLSTRLCGEARDLLTHTSSTSSTCATRTAHDHVVAMAVVPGRRAPRSRPRGTCADLPVKAGTE